MVILIQKRMINRIYCCALKDDHDGAEPSSNSVALLNLQRLYHFTGETPYDDKIKNTLRFFRKALETAPYGISHITYACLIYKADHKQVILTKDGKQLKKVLDRMYIPNKILMNSKSAYLKEKHAMVRDAVEVEDKPAAYVCQNFACSLPVSDPKELEVLLRKPSFIN